MTKSVKYIGPIKTNSVCGESYLDSPEFVAFDGVIRAEADPDGNTTHGENPSY
jgi:hypothetical protein